MQAIGIWYTPDLLADFSLVKEQIKKAKDTNFDILIAFYRWMHFNMFNEEAVKTTELSVAYAHELGMKFGVDSDPTWWQCDFVEHCPDAALRLLKRVETWAVGDEFSVFCRTPDSATEHVQDTFDRVVAVFVEEDGAYRFLDPAECKLKMEVGVIWKPDGPKRYNRVDGVAPGAGNGKVILYAAWKTFSYVDFAHREFLKQSKKLLDIYAHIPLDCVGWDEPGRVKGLAGCYRAGNAFFDFFREQKGYDLIGNLAYLDRGDDAHARKVRNDYYDAMTVMNIRAQAEHYDYAKELFGNDILLGTHQTWTALGDISIGYGDYFRTGVVLNPIWVDVYPTYEEDESRFDEMLHVYCLGDSLRKEYKKRNVYSNDYFIPIQHEQIAFFTRMKMLCDINWLYLWVGEHTEYMPNLNDRHAPEIAQAAQSLNDFRKFAGDDYRILTDTAVLYNPDGLYAFPRVNFGQPSKDQLQMRHHMLHAFLRRGRSFDFVGGISLERAEVSDGSFRVDDRTYVRLVLPWAAAVPQKVRPVLSEMMARGVQVIFAGPPMVAVAETGEDISAEFFELLGIRPFTLTDFSRFENAVWPKPPAAYPFSHRAFPLQAESAKVIAESHDLKPAVVQSRQRPNVYYDSSLDTLNRATYDLMPDTTETGIAVYVNHGYSKIYENPGVKGSYLVVLAAGMRNDLDAQVSVGSESIVFEGGTYAAVKVADGKIVADPVFTDAT